jgi:lipopolysaccharide biosynthesis protein
MTRRIAVAFFYDPNGIVDEYFTYLLSKTRPFVEKIILVSNGNLNKIAEVRVGPLVDQIIIRSNIGFDVGAYLEGLNTIGFDKIGEYDELVLFNHTFFGPIFPFSEMFDAMEERACDFWGITAHKEMDANPFVSGQKLPYHLQSHFIVVRRNLAASSAFKFYWEHMPPIETYEDSIVKHESRFTKYFEQLGYVHSVYIDPKQYGSYYPAFIDVDETIKDRCPILKRRIFLHDPLFHEENAIDVPRALELILKNSDYDINLIWKNILRSAELRNLNTVACLTSIFPDVRIQSAGELMDYGRVAVCAHVYYTEMLDELFEYASTISVPYDFIATTDSLEKKAEIEHSAAGRPGVQNVIVLQISENRGRDMSALFITCRDLFLDDRYDIVCRLHTKKSPQVMASRSNLFKRHMFENLLSSKGYTANVLDMFKSNPLIGLAIPPIVHISYWTFGHSWYGNDIKVNDIKKTLDLDIRLDPHTPVAPYGTMFWFRPKALRKLFLHEWKMSDFNAEPNHVDGGLAHALERAMAYVAQDAGYITMHVMNTKLAAWNYTALEFKLDRLLSKLPLTSLGHTERILYEWRRHAYSPLSWFLGRRLRSMKVSLKRSLREPVKHVLLRVKGAVRNAVGAQSSQH